MLQQTTVGTVLNKYPSFMKRFSSIESLALAKEDEVLNEWSGLGYYRRARNLKKAAEYFLRESNGRILLDYERLIQVPGIGEYTARALMSIGGDWETIAIDANLERVLSRFYLIKAKNIQALKKEILKRFDQKDILRNRNKFSCREINEALMDLGRTICRANSYECKRCPIQAECLARKQNKQHQLPYKEKKKKEQFELKLLRVIKIKGKKMLAYKKKEGEWLSGQLEIPTFIIETNDPNLKQYPKKKKHTKNLKSYKTTITKYKIENYVLIDDNFSGKDYQYYELDFKKFNFSTATKKALRLI